MLVLAEDERPEDEAVIMTVNSELLSALAVLKSMETRNVLLVEIEDVVDCRIVIGRRDDEMISISDPKTHHKGNRRNI